MRFISLAVFFFTTLTGSAQTESRSYAREHYHKKDTLISMRDGVKLYTVIYTPKDTGEAYPILFNRTPYSAGPYGDTNYRKRLGPNPGLMREKYIFVYQDVRGRYMSEGNQAEVTPHKPVKRSRTDVDESTDAFDSIDWLIKNLPNNNGHVGMYGISYDGFYTSAALPGAHPALKAASPQAPIADEFEGDDVNHNGAFFLMDNFNFINYYGKERKGPVKDYGNGIFSFSTKDMYDFFLRLGPLKNTLTERYFGTKVPIWNEYISNDSYSDYWKERNIRKHLAGIQVPVLVVGGWFDAENLFGALQTYQALEKGNNNNLCRLVMGPWTHGSWASNEWKSYVTHDFGSNTSAFFQDSIETVFFNHYLKGKGPMKLPEATVFSTGSNQWQSFNQWPPPAFEKTWYLHPDGKLSTDKPAGQSSEEYLSDPRKPVPYTAGYYGSRNNDYMAEDQRFAATRPDVMLYETAALEDSLQVSGPLTAELQVSMNGSDADFIVKLIDVLPASEPNFRNAPRGFQMAGYQRLVRAEVIRGKFRNSLENPEPFEPGKIHTVRLKLNDVFHTFKKGHRLMVQVQSSWFPLIDRNPQKFMRIASAEEKDYIKNNISIHYGGENGSRIILPILNKQ